MTLMKKAKNSTTPQLEIFVSAGTLQERDKKRCRLLRSLVKEAGNKVIKADIRWYGSVYSNIRNKFYMDGRTHQEVVDALIREYHF